MENPIPKRFEGEMHKKSHEDCVGEPSSPY